MQRVFAIGDIHGCNTALTTLLDMVEPDKDDLLIFLGDYIDRGPDSRGVIEQLISLTKRCRTVFLCGNHELMALSAMDDPEWLAIWQTNGGPETIASYGKKHLAHFFDIQKKHLNFFYRLKLFLFETETHFFVHGNVAPDIDLVHQSIETMTWDRFNQYNQIPHVSGKIMVCGHTPQISGYPLDLGHAICIDTFAFGGQWLSCFEVTSKEKKCFQANEKGESRILLLTES